MTYVSTVLADGAVGLWELGEAAPTTSSAAADQTGNQNGVYSNANFTGGVTGIPGGGGATAVSLKSSLNANKVTIADVAAQRLTDAAASLEFWVKRSATQGATQRIMGSANTNGFQMGWNSSNHIQVGKSGVANIVASTNTITDTTAFHHCAWTKAGATNHIYVDGSDVTGSVSNATLTTAAGWILFEDASNNSPPPTGMTLAMVAIYPTALSAATVANHYSLGSTAPSTSVNEPGFRFGFF